jgi:nucleoside phosphorylase
MAQHTHIKLSHDAYTVGWISPLEVEMSAARYLLDEEHAPLEKEQGDPNYYTLGGINGHNVVIGSLPAGYQGIASAATIATHMRRSFPSIVLRLLVGIGGGVPSRKADIRLGDVAISMPVSTHGGVVQYSLGKKKPDEFERKGFLCPPPTEWLAVLTRMMSDHRTRPNKVSDHLSSMIEKYPSLTVYKRPSPKQDILFLPNNIHVDENYDCSKCDRTRVAIRAERNPPDQPVVHYGLIASGDWVMKDGLERDRISVASGGAICFEMEAAGLMNEFPCIVVRGISDYADTHKNDEWHAYAAGSAAGLAKELLSYMDPSKPG